MEYALLQYDASRLVRQNLHDDLSSVIPQSRVEILKDCISHRWYST